MPDLRYLAPYTPYTLKTYPHQGFKSFLYITHSTNFNINLYPFSRISHTFKHFSYRCRLQTTSFRQHVYTHLATSSSTRFQITLCNFYFFLLYIQITLHYLKNQYYTYPLPPLVAFSSNIFFILMIFLPKKK